ncbi:MAG TPA: ATP-binding protein [Vicinamibacterales bacterium]|nr:ATP-binding protein [Vicinamibacterales bacterium]
MTPAFSDAERLRLALAAAHLGDWSRDGATDSVTLSTRAAEIFGVLPDAVMTWADLRERLHPDDRHRVAMSVEAAFTNRTSYAVEYRVRTAEGERWVAAHGHATYADDGAVTGSLGIVQDITEQVRTRELLQEHVDALQIINGVGRVLSAELDLKKVVQALTDAATNLVGAQFGAFFYNVLDSGGGSYTLYALSGVERRHLERSPIPRGSALLGPTFRGDGIIRIADVSQDPRMDATERHRGLPFGYLPVKSYLAIPVISRSGEVLGGLFFGHPQAAVFTDADERVMAGLAAQAAIAIDNARLFDAVQKAREAAEVANRLKDEFLATVSHELRTPLNAVLGWTSLLRGTQMDDARRAKALETIERNARLQQKIVEDLLDVSRIIAGQFRLEKEPMPFRPVVEAAIESTRLVAAGKSIALRVDLGDDPAIIIGDAARLQQVVWNLLSNAIKFTPAGGAVRVSLDVTESRVELVVSDTGIGIAPAFLPHAFERFRQGDARVTRAHGGLGLGLAIVRHLTEMHGGSVAAVSAGEGKGATFIVRLPTA